MKDKARAHVFLSYHPDNRDFVEHIARRLRGDARLSFWFSPWHAVPGESIQSQMENALLESQSCAVFVSDPGQIDGWQNIQMQAAIQNRVEDVPGYRVIPVLLPGTTRLKIRDLPRFLRLHETVEFQSVDDEQAFKRLLAGILGIPPIQVEDYIETEINNEQLPPQTSELFEHGHAVIIGVAHYPNLRSLPVTIVNDAKQMQASLTNKSIGAYPESNVTLLLDDQATGDNIRVALTDLASRAGSDDTAIIFFSGHGASEGEGDEALQYILPYDCIPENLTGTAISGSEMTEMLRNIQADRLLIIFDSCHSGGVGDPKSLRLYLKAGLAESYYERLSVGKGRVVMASSRPEEVSWVLTGMENSLFTYYLLEALNGQAKTLGDGFVRVFDLFRHVADHVPTRAAQANLTQHPILKISMLEDDFPIAIMNGQ